MSGQQTTPLLRTLCLLLSLAASSASAQLAWLSVAPGSAATPALGDTVVVDVHVDTHSRQLTSVSLSVSFDPGDLEILDASPGIAQAPFQVADQLAGGVYKNDLVHHAVDEARARVILVTSQQASQRQTILGRQVMAQVRWRVLRAAAATRISLVPSGPDGPVYTEIGQPGRQQSFQLQDPGLLLQLQSDGFVPIENLVLNAQQPWARDLRRIHPSDTLTWSVNHDADELLVAGVTEGQLRIHARPRVSGRGQISYRAMAGEQVVVQGDFSVEVMPGTALLDLGPLTLIEDGDPVPLEGLVASEAPAGYQLLLSGGPGLTVQPQGDTWHIAGEPDWSGPTRLTLRLLDGAAALIDSMQVAVTIVAVDDPPQLREVDGLVAVHGIQSWGPALVDLLMDVDDDFASLNVQVEGDHMVAAQIEAGRLRLLGLQVGVGQVRLEVIGAADERWEWLLDVHVAAQSLGPQFMAWVPARLPVGQSRTWMWTALVSDDEPIDHLASELEVSANLRIRTTQEGVTLEAMAIGDAWVRLLVVDQDGNTASTVLPLEVIALDAGSAADVNPAIDGSTPATGAETDIGQEESESASAGDEGTSSPEVRLIDQVHLDLPAELVIVAGTHTTIDLGGLLTGVDVEDVLWAASDGDWVQARVDEDGYLQLQAPVATTGTDQVNIHVYVDQQRVSVPLVIQLEAAPASLHILQMPVIRLMQGTSHELDLAAFAADAMGPVLWQVDPAQLVAVRIDDGILRLRAGNGQTGEEALRLAASDGTTNAFRLLRVIIEPDERQVLRMEAPATLTLSPGDRIDLDPSSWVTAGQVLGWEATSSSAAGSLTVEKGRVQLSIRTTAPAGNYTFTLEAITADDRIQLTLPVVVVRPPELVLDAAPVLRLGAGQRRALLRLDALILAADGQVQWQVLDAGRVQAAIGPLDSLVIDARQALPGRQVVRLRATTAARRQDLDIAILIAAPTIVPATWQVELNPGVVGHLSLDQQGPAELGVLQWSVSRVDSGIAAVFDDQTRRLAVLADQPGDIQLQASLDSGLIVGTLTLQVDLLKPTTPPAGADDAPVDTDDPASSQQPKQPTWQLQAPVFDPPWAGHAFSVELASMLVEPIDLAGRQLVWEARLLGGQGVAVIDGDSLIVTAHTSATLWIRAVDRDGGTLSIVAPVAVRSIPRPNLEIRVDDTHVRFDVSATSPATASLVVNHAPVSLSAEGRALLSLPGGEHALLVEASARLGSSQSVVTQRINVVFSGLNGSRMLAEDGLASIEIPRGLTGAALLRSHPDGYDLELSPRLQQAGVGLFIADSTDQLMGTDSAQLVTNGRSRIAAAEGVERWTSVGWVAVESYRIGAPAGLFATVVESGVYRRTAGDGVTMSLPAVHAYPNPFNAEVAIQFIVPEDGTELSIDLYNSLGQPTRTWQIQRPAGVGVLVWDGTHDDGHPAASGVYIVQIRSSRRVVSHKVLLVR